MVGFQGMAQELNVGIIGGGYAGMAVPNVISFTFLGQLTATMDPLTGQGVQIALAMVKYRFKAKGAVGTVLVLPLTMPEEVVRLVDRRWDEYGIEIP